MNDFIIFCTLKNIRLEIKFVDLWLLEVGVWSTPFLAFRIFCGSQFENAPADSASQNFPVNITDSYSIGCKLAEKYKFVDVWEGCMMGLLDYSLPNSASPMVQKSYILGLFLRGSLTNVNTNNNPATQFWY